MRTLSHSKRVQPCTCWRRKSFSYSHLVGVLIKPPRRLVSQSLLVRRLLLAFPLEFLHNYNLSLLIERVKLILGPRLDVARIQIVFDIKIRHGSLHRVLCVGCVEIHCWWCRPRGDPRENRRDEREDEEYNDRKQAHYRVPQVWPVLLLLIRRVPRPRPRPWPAELMYPDSRSAKVEDELWPAIETCSHQKTCQHIPPLILAKENHPPAKGPPNPPPPPKNLANISSGLISCSAHIGLPPPPPPNPPKG